MDQKAANQSGVEKRRWGSEKDQPASYTPFKSVNGGRSASYMDDIYQPSMSMRCDAEVAAVNENAAGHHQPGRAPSRAGSIYASSVLYQPLLSANQVNAAWGNSMIKPLSSDSGAFSSTTLPPPTPNGGRFGGAVQAEPDPYNNNNHERSRKQGPTGTVVRSSSSGGYEQRQQQGFAPPAYNRSDSPDLQVLSASKLNGTMSHVKKSQNDKNSKRLVEESVGNLGRVLRSRVRHHRGGGAISTAEKGRHLTPHEKQMLVFERLSFVRLTLGLCIFSLGVSRLALDSVWAFGVDLIFGLFVAGSALCGLIACKKRNVVALTAFLATNLLSPVLAILPIISGLMVTIPFGNTKFHKLPAEYFTSDTEPYSLDIASSTLSILDALFAIFCSAWCCFMTPKILERSKQYGDLSEQVFGWRGKQIEDLEAAGNEKNAPTLKTKFDHVPQYI